MITHAACSLGAVRPGSLRVDLDKVLVSFRRKIHPEVYQVPEKTIIERLRAAILGDNDQFDPRSVVLILLARAVNLLDSIL